MTWTGKKQRVNRRAIFTKWSATLLFSRGCHSYIHVSLHCQMSAMTPVGYVGAPQDIANLVGFIASKEAHFITGQSVSYWMERKPIVLTNFMFFCRFRVMEDGILTNSKQICRTSYNDVFLSLQSRTGSVPALEACSIALIQPKV